MYVTVRPDNLWASSGRKSLHVGRIAVNAFSMHNFYRNRLIRCYIGASDDNCNQDPWTGFDVKQYKVCLCELANRLPGAVQEPDVPLDGKKDYLGPFHILNSTRKLVCGGNLAWQKRKASSFIMSSLFCGYDVRAGEKVGLGKAGCNNPAGRIESCQDKLENSGYRLTNLYADNIFSGTAMAISGAAVSPSMRHYSSAAVAFLMTVFFSRLLSGDRHLPISADKPRQESAAPCP